MVFLGADHQGRAMIAAVAELLKKLGAEFEEVGKEIYSDEDDYTDFAAQIAIKVLGSNSDFGILLCGSGQGMVIAANRFRGIRAGLCWNVEEAALARSDDNINILCLPVKVFGNGEEGSAQLEEVLKAFLQTEFKNAPRYMRRIEKLDRLP